MQVASKKAKERRSSCAYNNVKMKLDISKNLNHNQYMKCSDISIIRLDYFTYERFILRLDNQKFTFMSIVVSVLYIVNLVERTNIH